MGNRRSILLTINEQETRRLYRMTLVLDGFDVLEAADGLEALQVIELGPPDLIVLELELSKLDGLSVQQEIAAHAFTRHIPVVLITAADVDLGGADVSCVLRKPVAPDDLVRTVRSCLTSGAPGVGL